jgi:predicted phage tail protein
MKEAGIILSTMGVVLIVGSWFLDVTAAGHDVVNLQKMQVQLMVFQMGTVMFLAGNVLIAANAIVERLNRGAD